MISGLLLASAMMCHIAVIHPNKSCQICCVNGAIKVCKFEKRCDIEEEPKESSQRKDSKDRKEKKK